MKRRFLVVGGGPAGLYASKFIKKRLKDFASIDIIEKRPILGGLLRLGVAPDHYQIKQSLYNYTQFLEDNSSQGVRVFSNINLDKPNLDYISQFYDGVVISNGSDQVNDLKIEGQDLLETNRVISGYDFVKFYNQDFQSDIDPIFQQIKNIKEAKTVVIIGNGNMSIDICRVLTRDWNAYKKQNKEEFGRFVPEQLISWLEQNNFKKIVVLGRRGMVQSAFSLKELKELVDLSPWNVYVNPSEFRNSLNLQSLEECNVKKNFLNRKVIPFFYFYFDL